MQVTRYSRNTAGRDIVVGDIHGFFPKLQAALDAVAFDAARDRLFSVGDMVDRGPASEDVLTWLAQPWFHPVLGNHEQMAIWTVRGGMHPENYLQNGGAWLLGLPKAYQHEFADAFDALPIAIELETENGIVGIVHADCPAHSWQQLRDSVDGPGINVDFITACVWSRDRFDSQFGGLVEGVAAVVVGHTPMTRCTSLGNVIYIDTGAWLPEHRGGGDFTLLDAATLRPLPLPTRKLAFES